MRGLRKVISAVPDVPCPFRVSSPNVSVDLAVVHALLIHYMFLDRRYPVFCQNFHVGRGKCLFCSADQTCTDTARFQDV